MTGWPKGLCGAYGVWVVHLFHSCTKDCTAADATVRYMAWQEQGQEQGTGNRGYLTIQAEASRCSEQGYYLGRVHGPGCAMAVGCAQTMGVSTLIWAPKARTSRELLLTTLAIQMLATACACPFMSSVSFVGCLLARPSTVLFAHHTLARPAIRN